MKIELSKHELDFLVSIIDICSTRGAFKGEELESVGVMRRKLSNLSKVENEVENKDDA